MEVVVTAAVTAGTLQCCPEAVLAQRLDSSRNTRDLVIIARFGGMRYSAVIQDSDSRGRRILNSRPAFAILQDPVSKSNKQYYKYTSHTFLLLLQTRGN